MITQRVSGFSQNPLTLIYLLPELPIERYTRTETRVDFKTKRAHAMLTNLGWLEAGIYLANLKRRLQHFLDLCTDFQTASGNVTFPGGINYQENNLSNP